jgi:hypothetical protein
MIGWYLLANRRAGIPFTGFTPFCDCVSCNLYRLLFEEAAELGVVMR